ncbi:MAG: hypothetical protein ABS36_15485 [Acidobacteria bacterium SCN 69-37]|nr:MAG: hypothetical protein ABS36_15485 [Acidobacteria bacterium SCN 69-37]
MWMPVIALAVATAGTMAVTTSVQADEQAASAPGGRQAGPGRAGGQGGRGGGTPQGGAPIAWEDTTGFRSMFDGRSLDGWDGDPAFWRVEGGAIVGESTAETPVTENNFLIWRGGRTADFDLKLEFRLNAGNSGVQYRSRQLVPGGPEGVKGQWVLAGYQADIDFNNQYTGMLYEERGRGFLAPRGQFNYIGANQAPAVGRGQPPPQPRPGDPPFGVRGQLGALNANDALRALIKQNDWNQFQVVARGNVLIHMLNGQVTAVLVDDDVTGRALDGLLGLQIHVGPPMKVEFRNIYIRQH